MSGQGAQSRDFFERRYQATPDPWNFAGSPYEQERYRATLAALSNSRYRRAFEPGCSVGVLTAALADRCDEVVASDISEAAVRTACERCRTLSNVTIAQGDLRSDLPQGMFDLIIFSEVGYYCTQEQLVDVIGALSTKLMPDGEFVAVHWLGHSPDHLLHGDDVHNTLLALLPFAPNLDQRYPGFRINTWRRTLKNAP